MIKSDRTIRAICKELIDNPVLPLLFFHEGVKKTVEHGAFLHSDVTIWFALFVFFTIVWVFSDAVGALWDFLKSYVIGVNGE